MTTLLLILILVVLGFIANGLNPGFSKFLRSIFNLSLGIGMLLFFLLIMGLVIWGGYYLLTKFSDLFPGALYLSIVMLLLYGVVGWPLTRGQDFLNFLKKKGLTKKDHPRIFVAIVLIVGVIFVALLGLLLNRLGL